MQLKRDGHAITGRTSGGSDNAGGSVGGTSAISASVHILNSFHHFYSNMVSAAQVTKLPADAPLQDILDVIRRDGVIVLTGYVSTSNHELRTTLKL